VSVRKVAGYLAGGIPRFGRFAVRRGFDQVKAEIKAGRRRLCWRTGNPIEIVPLYTRLVGKGGKTTVVFELATGRTNWRGVNFLVRLSVPPRVARLVPIEIVPLYTRLVGKAGKLRSFSSLLPGGPTGGA
jgi:hypothetical protein